jgi:hypothetical protein
MIQTFFIIFSEFGFGPTFRLSNVKKVFFLCSRNVAAARFKKLLKKIEVSEYVMPKRTKDASDDIDSLKQNCPKG